MTAGDGTSFVTHDELDKIIARETVTTWAKVRRYVVLGGMMFVIIDLAITLTVVVLLANATRASDKEHATKACRNTAALATIDRTNVIQQQQATDKLVAQGNTLGIPPKQFAQLVRDSKAQQAEYLKALDNLVTADCETLDFKPVVIVPNPTGPSGPTGPKP